MQKNLSRVWGILLGFSVLTACQKDAPYVSPDQTTEFHKNEWYKSNFEFYALTDANQLIRYSGGRKIEKKQTIKLTGLATGEMIKAIDFRPATGQLYGVSTANKIYTINQYNGVVYAIGVAFTPALNSSNIGMDFNPTVDRIRLVTDAGQNLRANPETGAIVATDGNLNPGTPMVGAVAYTNNFAGTTTTTLYDIDAATDKLYMQNPPNNGTLALVGSLGVDVKGEAGFDINSNNTIALAVLETNKEDDKDDDEKDGDVDEDSYGKDYPKTKKYFYSINLSTGKATKIAKAERNIIGLAIPTDMVAYGVDEMNQLLIFNPMNPGTMITKTITVPMGEKIVGIDFRPATAQLYAVSSASKIYALNLSSGAATLVGTGFAASLTASNYAMDFNPTVDRIRLIGDNGQNLRLNPITGGLAATDANLNPGMPKVDAVAYTNNIPGATTTTLYDIDYGTDSLYIQNPPNNGTLVGVGSLGVKIDGGNGFDIGSTSGKAYAVLNTGSRSGIYQINLMTGRASKIADLSKKFGSFTIGLGF